MNKIIHLETVLNMNVAECYKYFTENTLLEKWLSVKADIEPVLGGKFELFWNPEDKENNSTIGCRITAIKQNELLAFEWKSPVQFKHFANQADPLTHVVIGLFSIEPFVTKIHLIHSGWRITNEWETARFWQEQAWSIAFENLENLINKE